MGGFYSGESPIAVILVTVVLGGGAAFLSGRAIAGDWRAPWQVAVAAVLLGAASRFIHYALFQGDLVSLRDFFADTLFFLLIGLFAWRLRRTHQMVRQYPWLYARAGLLGWREIGQGNER